MPKRKLLTFAGDAATLRLRPLAKISSCGLFDCLPPEILFELFRYLPLKEVGNLALTSEGLRVRVSQWISTTRCSKRAIETLRGKVLAEEIDFKSLPSPNVGPEDFIKAYVVNGKLLNDYAILLKKTSMLFATRDRAKHCLRMMLDACNGYFLNSKPGELNTVPWVRTMQFVQFTTMVQTFTRGWDDTEFRFVIENLDKAFGLRKAIDEITRNPDRQAVGLELEIESRLAIRCLCWDIAGNDYNHRANWILSVMNYFAQENAKDQAMLFLTFFGQPCVNNFEHYPTDVQLLPQQNVILSELYTHTDFNSMIVATPLDFHEGKEMFYTLAQAISSCFGGNQVWRDEMCCDVLDALFETPEKWERENVAGFLLFCCENLIRHYLTRKLDEGDQFVDDVGRLLFDMIVMSFTFENDIAPSRGIGKVFDDVLNHSDLVTRLQLIKSLSASIGKNLASCVTKDVEEMEDDEEDELDGNDRWMDVMISFGSYLMNKASQAKEPLTLYAIPVSIEPVYMEE